MLPLDVIDMTEIFGHKIKGKILKQTLVSLQRTNYGLGSTSIEALLLFKVGGSGLTLQLEQSPETSTTTPV